MKYLILLIFVLTHCSVHAQKHELYNDSLIIGKEATTITIKTDSIQLKSKIFTWNGSPLSGTGGLQYFKTLDSTLEWYTKPYTSSGIFFKSPYSSEGTGELIGETGISYLFDPVDGSYFSVNTISNHGGESIYMEESNIFSVGDGEISLTSYDNNYNMSVVKLKGTGLFYTTSHSTAQSNGWIPDKQYVDSVSLIGVGTKDTAYTYYIENFLHTDETNPFMAFFVPKAGKYSVTIDCYFDLYNATTPATTIYVTFPDNFQTGIPVPAVTTASQYLPALSHSFITTTLYDGAYINLSGHIPALPSAGTVRVNLGITLHRLK